MLCIQVCDTTHQQQQIQTTELTVNGHAAPVFLGNGSSIFPSYLCECRIFAHPLLDFQYGLNLWSLNLFWRTASLVHAAGDEVRGIP